MIHPPPLPEPALREIPPEPLRLGTILAWLVIIATIVAATTMQWHVRQMRPPRSTNAGDDVALRITSRYAVGTKIALSALSSGSSSTTKPSRDLAMQVERLAATPAQQLRIVPVIAELQGADAALELLEKMEFPTDSQELRNGAEAFRAIYTHGPDALDAQQRALLLERYGWFAQLALGWGRAPGDPARDAARSAALRTFIISIIAVLAALGVSLTGLVLLVVAIVLVSQGTLRATYRPLAHNAGLFLESFAIYLAWFVGIGLLAHAIGAPGRTVLIWTILGALAPLACLWPMVRGMSLPEWRGGLGFHAGRGIAREIGAGIAGYVAGVPVLILGIVITVLLSKLARTQPTHPAVEMISSDFWRVVFLLMLASVYAPLAEETMFRGALYGGMRRSVGIILSTLVVSFIFAAIHPQGWTGVPALMSIAIVFALLREWRGSLIAPITAHALNNGVVIIFLVLVAG